MLRPHQWSHFAVEEVDERVPDVRISPAIREALVALDRIHLPDVFRRRGHGDESSSQDVPRSVLRGVAVSHERGESGTPERFNVSEARVRVEALPLDSTVIAAQAGEGWVLIPRRKLRERLEKIRAGDIGLNFKSLSLPWEDAAQTRRSRGQPRSFQIQSVTEHGQSLLPILESLSAARDSSGRSPLRSRWTTLRALQDERRRPTERPGFPIPQEVMDHRPEVGPSIGPRLVLGQFADSTERGPQGGLLA